MEVTNLSRLRRNKTLIELVAFLIIIMRAQGDLRYIITRGVTVHASARF